MSINSCSYFVNNQRITGACFGGSRRHRAVKATVKLTRNLFVLGKPTGTLNQARTAFSAVCGRDKTQLWAEMSEAMKEDQFTRK